MDKHIGYPLPSEMFAPEKEKEDFDINIHHILKLCSFAGCLDDE